MSTFTRIGPARRLAVVSACAVAIALGGATSIAVAEPSQTRDPNPPDVGELTERFPIGTETVTVEEPVARPPAVAPPVEDAVARPPAVAPPVEDSGSMGRGAIAASIGAVLVLMVVGAGVLLVRRRQSRSAPIWSSTPNLALLHETLASANREWNKARPTVHSTERSPPVSEVSQDPKLPQQATPEPRDVPQDTPVDDAAGSLEHAGVAERISAILQSAEVAAEAIRQEALVKAEEIRQEALAKAEEIAQAAEKEGQTHLARAKEEAARVRNDAEAAVKDAQSAAESYGATQRREAEQRVQQILAEAEAQARATRQAAEEMARQIEGAAREREAALQAQMRPLESSLQRALDAFRGITAQLEDLLGSGSAREPEDLVELERGYYVSFTEALGEPVRRTDQREEAAQPQEQRNG